MPAAMRPGVCLGSRGRVRALRLCPTLRAPARRIAHPLDASRTRSTHRAPARRIGHPLDASGTRSTHRAPARGIVRLPGALGHTPVFFHPTAADATDELQLLPPCPAQHGRLCPATRAALPGRVRTSQGDGALAGRAGEGAARYSVQTRGGSCRPVVGRAGTVPGRAGTVPGRAGTVPGRAGTVPGRADRQSAHPHLDPAVLGRALTRIQLSAALPGRPAAGAPRPVPGDDDRRFDLIGTDGGR